MPIALNYSVETLVLPQYIALGQHLHYIPYLYLTSLKNLVIEHFCDRDDVVRTGSFLIRMRNSTLKYLEICLDSYSLKSLGTTYIRLTTSDGSNTRRYCFLLPDDEAPYHYSLIENLTEIDYANSIDDNTIVNCDIYCKSVEKFVVKYYRRSAGDFLISVTHLASFSE